jgi:hypothetical protein
MEWQAGRQTDTRLMPASWKMDGSKGTMQSKCSTKPLRRCVRTSPSRNAHTDGAT